MLEFKAARYSNKDSDIVVETTSLPVEVKDGKYVLPSEKQMLIKVKYAALNPVDLIFKNSLSPWIFRGKRGIGLDFSGEVVAAGSAAKGFAEGDAVSGIFRNIGGDGTVAEYILVDPSSTPGKSIRKMAEGVSFKEAAATGVVLGTAIQMFDDARVEKGNQIKKILILAAGTSVGRYAVQLAKNHYGCEEIVVTCSARSEETSRSLGATSVIDYTKHKSLLQPVLESVKESGKFDAVLDCAGNSDLFGEMANILKDRKELGSYCTIAGDRKANFQTETFLGMALAGSGMALRLLRSATGFLPYYYNFTGVDVAHSWPDLAQKLLGEKKLKVCIDTVYPMSEIQAAAKKLSTATASGKIVVEILE